MTTAHVAAHIARRHGHPGVCCCLLQGCRATDCAVNAALVASQDAAPDATAGDGLRSVADSQMECDVAEVLHCHDSIVWGEALDLAARVLALPALRDVLAAAARDAELRVQIEILTRDAERFPTHDARSRVSASNLRHALDPS